MTQEKVYCRMCKWREHIVSDWCERPIGKTIKSKNYLGPFYKPVTIIRTVTEYCKIVNRNNNCQYFVEEKSFLNRIFKRLI